MIRVAKIVASIILAAVVGVLGFAAYSIFPHFDYDILDKFEVIGVVTVSGSNRHAVTYRYGHADSSRQVIATWIFEGPPPKIVATDPVHGMHPVLVWTDPSDAVDQKCVGERLVVSARDH